MRYKKHSYKAIHFLRWSRKKYALFAVIGKTVHICRLKSEMCDVAIQKNTSFLISQLALKSFRFLEEFFDALLENKEDACWVDSLVFLAIPKNDSTSFSSYKQLIILITPKVDVKNNVFTSAFLIQSNR